MSGLRDHAAVARQRFVPGGTTAPRSRPSRGTRPRGGPGPRSSAPGAVVVAVGRPVTVRNDCKAWELSGAKAAVGRATVITDGGYRGAGLPIPHRRERGQTELPDREEEHNTSHRKVRARVEHVFARTEAWKSLRDRRLKGDGVHTAVLGIARLHNLAVAG